MMQRGLMAGLRWGVFVMGLAVWPVQAHEFWIVAEPASPQAGEKTVLRIAGGHGFPRDEGGPSERLIRRVALQSPDGAWAELEPADDGTYPVRVEQAGWYRALMILQAPRAPRPVYYAQSLFCVADLSGAWPAPLGEGVEIVVRRKDEASAVFRVLRDGAPVHARLLVQGAGEGTSPVHAPIDEGALLLMSRDRPVLISTTVGPQAASLYIHFGQHHDRE